MSPYSAPKLILPHKRKWFHGLLSKWLVSNNKISLVNMSVTKLYWLLFCWHNKTPLPRQPREERMYLGLQFQSVRVQNGWDSTVASSEQDGRNRKLRTHILNNIQGTGWVMNLITLKTLLQWCIASNKAAPPNSSQTAPPTGQQVVKHQHLWGTFSFKSPQKKKKKIFKKSLQNLYDIYQ